MSGSPFFQKTSVKKNQNRFHQQNIYTGLDPNNNTSVKEYNQINTCLSKTPKMQIITLIILLIMHAQRIAPSPIALNKLVVMTPDSKGTVIRLQGVEKSGNQLTYVISKLPARGTLYQLSSVYSSHGYEPIQGTQITTKTTPVTGSMNRVYYKHSHRRLCSEHADSFSYKVVAHAQAKGDAQAKGQNTNTPQPTISNEGTITIVDSSGTIVCSDFLLGPDGWTIIGNKERVSNPIYEPYSRNNMCNHYIYATDNHNHISTTNPLHTHSQRDKALWYFNAPSKMLGNIGIAYGGHISFTISIFAGDLKQMNQGVNLVELECSRCGYNNGITMGYPIPTNPIKNNMASFKIELTETANWLTQDTTTPTKCEFIQVLSQLSGLRILGDLTTWTETVALDNVYIIGNTNNSINNSPIIPLCAMSKPDASICTCV